MKFKMQHQEVYGVPELIVGEVHLLKKRMNAREAEHVLSKLIESELKEIHTWHLCFQDINSGQHYCVSSGDLTCGDYKFTTWKELRNVN